MQFINRWTFLLLDGYSITICTNVHDPHRDFPNDFEEPLTFSMAPPWSGVIGISEWNVLKNSLKNCQETWNRLFVVEANHQSSIRNASQNKGVQTCWFCLSITQLFFCPFSNTKVFFDSNRSVRDKKGGLRPRDSSDSPEKWNGHNNSSSLE